MKKTLSILVVLTLFSSIAFAGGINKDPKKSTKTGSTVIKKGSVFKLFYKGDDLDNVRVTIYNSNDEPVFKETLRNTDGFMRPYNLNKLEEGEYKLVIADKHGEQSQSLQHFAEKSQTLIGVIQLSETPEKFVLTIGKKLSPEVVAVKIYNDRNEIIYEQLENIKGDFSKLYDLGKADSYRFEITDSNGTTSIIKNKNILIASK